MTYSSKLKKSKRRKSSKSIVNWWRKWRMNKECAMSWVLQSTVWLVISVCQLLRLF